jgi:hypothetical protein
MKLYTLFEASYSAEQKKQIVDRVKAGEPIATLSKELGVSYTTIKGWAMAAGIEFQPSKAGRKGVVSGTDWPTIIADYLKKKQEQPELSVTQFIAGWGVPSTTFRKALLRYGKQAEELLKQPQAAPPPAAPAPAAPAPTPVSVPPTAPAPAPAAPAPTPTKPVEQPLRGWTENRKPNVLLVGGRPDDMPKWMPRFFNMYHADLEKFNAVGYEVLKRHFGNKNLDLIITHTNLIAHESSYGAHELGNKLHIAVLPTRGGFSSTVPIAQKLGITWYVDAFIRASRKLKEELSFYEWLDLILS